MEKKVYLGDGLYYAFDGNGVWLTAENGVSVSNRVYLEPEVLAAFLKQLGSDFDRGKLRAVIGEPQPELIGNGEPATPIGGALVFVDGTGALRIKDAKGNTRPLTERNMGEVIEFVIPDSVQLSNKACPHYYSDFSDGKVAPSKKCGCPDGRCWYNEQLARRSDGEQAIAPEFWLRVVRQ